MNNGKLVSKEPGPVHAEGGITMAPEYLNSPGLRASELGQLPSWSGQQAVTSMGDSHLSPRQHRLGDVGLNEP